VTRRRALYLDPYHTASHRALARELTARSRHEIGLLTLPARKWKWRMRGAALAMEPIIRAGGPPPDLLITTDFMNVPELLALTRDLWPRPVPVITYFHENQLTYPAGSADVRDMHFALVNIHSALASDLVLFNSDFHRDEFVDAVDDLIGRMPDHRPERVGARIRARSSVLGLPLDLEGMERARVAAGAEGAPRPEGSPRPLVLWNHRWEEDRNPREFFEAMERLDAMASEGRAPDFGLAVAGQTFRTTPAVFGEYRERLAHRIGTWGFIESREEYLGLLADSSVVLSTSRHEFFGVSVMEAIFMGCAPVLPRRLTYPGIALGEGAFLYDDPGEIPAKVAALLGADLGEAIRPLRERIMQFDAASVVARWDDLIDSVIGHRED
jgi:glycosyltransferase involved in cell wall biosynthesis